MIFECVIFIVIFDVYGRSGVDESDGRVGGRKDKIELITPRERKASND